jgi:hypothetical protein
VSQETLAREEVENQTKALELRDLQVLKREMRTVRIPS